MSGLNTYVRLLAAASIGLSQITVGVSARAAEGAERPASIVFEGVPITPMVKAEIQHAAEVGDLTRGVWAAMRAPKSPKSGFCALATYPPRKFSE